MATEEILQTLPQTVSMETLRQWMVDGAPVTVLDVRPLADRSEWAIPGSVHVDAYDALWARDPRALDAAELPRDRTIVTVCAAGRTSLLASTLLRSRGIPACSLEGGMKAWSGAWNLAEVPVPGLGARVIQVRRTGKGCLSYVVAADGNAAVIDASVQPEVYLQIADREGWRIVSVIETHIHADHVSRAHALAAATDARVFLPAQKRVSFPHVPVEDGDAIRLGEREGLLRSLRTPGHTRESTCYLLADGAVLTGDTLFLHGVGRPDLGAGSAAETADTAASRTAAAETDARARSLYHSLSRLRALPGDTVVLPGHTSEPTPFDGAPHAAPLARVIAENPALSLDQKALVALLTAGGRATPRNHEQIIRYNEMGAAPMEDPTDLEFGANRCAVG